jgi:hypothetical protein
MLCADVLVGEPLSFLCRVGEDTFAFVGEGKIDRGRYLLSDGSVAFNLLADGFHRGVRPQKAIGQRFVLTQQAEQQMLCFNVGRPELTGLVPRKEDYATRFLRIAFEHISPSSHSHRIRPKARYGAIDRTRLHAACS